MFDLLERYADIKKRIGKIEGILSVSGRNIKGIRLLMSIVEIDVYSAMGLYSDIGTIGRLSNGYKLASHSGVVPRVDQNREKAHYGRIAKNVCHW